MGSPFGARRCEGEGVDVVDLMGEAVDRTGSGDEEEVEFGPRSLRWEECPD